MRLLQRDTVLGIRFAQCSRVFIGVEFSTVPGYTALLHALLRGGTVVVQTHDQMETLRAISSHQVQVLFASPQTLAEILAAYQKAADEFRKVDILVPLGSSINAKLLRALRATLCDEVVSLYGSTELASVATASMAVIEHIDGAVGYPVSGVSIDILDAEGKPLPAGKVSRICIRSKFAATGYTEGHLDNITRFPEAGVVPGDIGAMTPGGLLIVAGRESSVVNLGGSKVSLERIEAVLTSFVNVEDAGAFTFQNQMGINQLAGAVVWSRDTDRVSARKRLRAHLESVIPRAHLPNLFIELDEIPRNHMGKIDRERLKSRVLDTMTRTGTA